MYQDDCLSDLIARYPNLAVCRRDLENAFEILCACYEAGGKVLTLGNGGSASDALHIVGELMKSFTKKRGIGSLREKLYQALPAKDADYLAANLQGALCAISLMGETALVSAYTNDAQPDLVYAQQVLGYGKPGDVLIVLSTSGNSSNVLRAVQTAKAMGLRCIGLTGIDGGALAKLCDVAIKVPEKQTYLVQELHLPVYHALCRMLEAHFFPQRQ